MPDEPKSLTREAVEELEALIIDAKSAAEWSWKFPELFATLAAKEEEIERLKTAARKEFESVQKLNLDNASLRKRIAELEAKEEKALQAVGERLPGETLSLAIRRICDSEVAARGRVAELEAASSDDKYCAHCNAILLTDKSCPVCTRSKRIAELEEIQRACVEEHEEYGKALKRVAELEGLMRDTRVNERTTHDGLPRLEANALSAYEKLCAKRWRQDREDLAEAVEWVKKLENVGHGSGISGCFECNAAFSWTGGNETGPRPGFVYTVGHHAPDCRLDAFLKKHGGQGE